MRKRRGKNKSTISRLLAICISLVLAISGTISISALLTYSADDYISSKSAENVTEIPVSEELVSEEPGSEDPINDDDELVKDEKVDAIITGYGGGLNQVTVSEIEGFNLAFLDPNVDVIVLDGSIISAVSFALDGTRELTVRGGTIYFENNAFSLNVNSTLTLDGVRIRGHSNEYSGIKMKGGSSTLNLKGGTEITGFREGVHTSLLPVIAVNNIVNVYYARIYSNLLNGLNAGPGNTINLQYGAVVSGSSIGIALLGEDAGTLNIFDGSVISGNTNGVAFSGYGGEVNMYEGAVIRNNGGRGVFMLGNGKFNMNGGLITGNGHFGQAASNGVRIVNGIFTMGDGGSINGNNGRYGGGVHIGQNGKFIMEGGEIRRNTLSSGGSGGGVFVDGGRFEMEDGVISEHVTSTFGGGVAVLNGTFEMNGGKIADNEAETGGGIFTENFANITIGSSAVFAGNTASSAFWLEDSPTVHTYRGLNAAQIEALPNIAWNSLSYSGMVLPFNHLANNYDLNFVGKIRVIFRSNCHCGYLEIIPVTSGDIVYDDIPTFTFDNHNFTVWNKSASGGGAAFNITEPITRNLSVFAQWESLEVPSPGPDIVAPPLPPEPGDGDEETTTPEPGGGDEETAAPEQGDDSEEIYPPPPPPPRWARPPAPPRP
ncbi:MAG: hypothetical protein FWE29_05355, partial [Defluviitaleaceae bacterium]|nr:hypothetical protein [Defluviitaleaceae bacterium]